MARLTNIRLRRSSVSGNVPSTSDLDLGELAINTYDGKLYLKKNVSGTESIVEIGAGGGTGLSSAFTLYEYTATANQTTFSGSDQNSNTLSYDTGSPPKVQVYLNGVLLDWTTDFTATNGTSVVLTNGAAASDLLQVAAYKSESTVVNDLALGDNQKIKFGDDDDLEIYHNGSKSIINDAGTGELEFQVGGTAIYDVTADGIVLADGLDVEASEFIGDLRGAVLFKAQAGEALSKGDVVYISGISGNTTIVSKADANDSAKMPAFGVAAAAASINTTVDIYTNGILSGLDTSSFTVGDELYVSNTAGALTNSAPAGESSLLQKIAKVTRSDNSAGSIFITGAGRTNAVPNLDQDQFFLGNASNQAVATDFSNAVEAISINNVVEDITPQLGGDLASNGNDILFADSDKAIFGAGSDLQIYHDGSNSWISEGGTGSLIVGADNFYIRNAAGNESKIDAISNGAVTLYYDNSAKLATTSTGIDVTGELNATGLLKGVGGVINTNTGSNPFYITRLGNTSEALKIYTSDSGAFFESIQDETVDNYGNFIFAMDSGTTEPYFDIRKGTASSGSKFYVDGSGKVAIGSINPSRQFEIHENNTYLTIGEKTGYTPSTYGPILETNANALVLPATAYLLGSQAYVQNASNSLKIHGDSGIQFGYYNGSTSVVGMKLDTSGRLGIGTTSPLHPLTVNGVIHSTSNIQLNSAAKVLFGNGNQYVTGTNDTSLQLATGGSASLTVDNSGNVGIGTTSPSSLFHLKSGNRDLNFILADSPSTGNVGVQLRAGAGDYIGLAGSGTGVGLVIDSSNNVGIGETSIDANLHITHTNPNLKFEIAGSGKWAIGMPAGQTYLAFDETNDSLTTPTMVMTKTTKRVGIGTTSPQSPLHVYSGDGGTYTPNANHDDLTIEGSGNIGLQLFSPNNSYQYVAFGDPDSVNAGYIRYYHGSNTMVLRTGGSDKVHILNNGDVGIGDSSPSYKLDVNGTGRFTGAVTMDSTLTFSNTTAANMLNLSNNNIIGVNTIQMADPGPNEGISWSNIKIYESPDDLTTNSAGNFQVVYSGTRRLTVNSSGIDVNGTISSGNITTTGYLRGPSTFTIDPATHGDNTGTVVIAGNLQIDGTTTTINSTTLTVDDKLVTLASGSANAGAANGAGIEVDISGSTNPSLLYDGTNDEWDFNKNVKVSGSLGVTNIVTNKVVKFNGTILDDSNITDTGSLITLGSATDVSGPIQFTSNVSFSSSEAGRIYKSSQHGLAFHGVAGTENNFAMSTPAGQLILTNPDNTNNALLIPSALGGRVGVATTTPYDGARMHICADDTSPSLNTTAIDDATLILSNSDDDYGTVFATQGTGVGLIQQRRMATATYYDLLLQPYGKAVGVRRTSADSNYAMHIGSPGLLVDSFSGSNGIKVYRGTELYTQIQHDSSNAFLDVGNVPHRFRVGGVDVLTLDDSTNSRNVGIGTTNPNTKLHVYDNVNRTSIKAQNNNHSAMFEAYGTATAIDSDASNGIFLRISGANKVHLDNNGNFGVNVTDPQAKFQVEEYGIDTTETSSTATTQIAIHTFAAATFRSARFTVQVTNSTDSTYHTTELLLVHDGTTANITEFGEIFTGSAAEATFDADISSGNVRLLATPASTDTMEFKVVAHTVTV